MGQTTVGTRRRVGLGTRIVGVIGELFLTAGVIAMLYVVWQMWVGDWIISSQQHREASALSESWIAEGGSTPPLAPPTDPGTTDTDAGSSAGDIPVLAPAEFGAEFGVMYVPRFGADWQFTIAGGTARHEILDEGKIGHYDDTAMPGAEGNTVYAAHRWTGGAAFDPIDKLVIGDAIVVHTPVGWYTYRFRTLEYVQDTQIDVLLPVPQQVDVAPNGRYLTLTSCAPKLNMLERIIAYAVFESFTPTSDGPPASLDLPTQGAHA